MVGGGRVVGGENRREQGEGNVERGGKKKNEIFIFC